MRRSGRCLVCAVALGAIAALATAQERSHDALATARAKAVAQNQRVLLLLNGGDAALGEALAQALTDDQALGKLLRYEFQLAAQPAASLAGEALRQKLQLADVALPALAVLDTGDRLLATITPEQMTTDGRFDAARVREALEAHACAPLSARAVLAQGLTTAKNSERQAFVYLSAPW